MRFFFLLLIIILSTPRAWADTLVSRRDNLIQVQKILEDELSDILKAWDPKALVTTRVYEHSENLPVPTTPYTMPGVSIRDSDDNPVIDQIRISILSAKPKLPKSLEKVIRETVAGYGPVNLLFQTITADMQAEIAPGKTSEQLQKEKEKEKEEEERSVAAAAATLRAEKLEAEKRQNKQDMLKTILGLIPGVFIFFAFIILLGILKKGFSTIGRGFAQKEAPAEPAMPMAAPQAVTATATSHAGGGGPSDPEKSTISRLPIHSVVELFGDAYWGEFDDYAAFIWHQLSIDARKKMMEQIPWVNSYVASLSGKAEQSLGYEDETYYLDPLPFAQLNNDMLSEIVRQMPALIDRLSSLRVQRLTIGAIERIELMNRSGAETISELPDFSSFPPSQPRKVASRRQIPIKTIEEEEAILQLDNLSPEIMELVPSLGWLIKLTDSEIAKILSRFNPEDLATAWIGPKHVLDRLANCLPEKKRHWVASFSRSHLPDRNSPVFMKLHDLGVEAHKRQAEQRLDTERIAA